MILYHGTNQLDFREFDMSHVEPCNVGFHFGTEAAARSRVDYLRSHSPNKSYRILKCQVEINAPYRVGDVFGHSYGGVFSALEDEAARQKADTIQEEIKDLIAEWLGSEDDPALTGGEWALAEYNARLNREVCRLFKTLGYDGLVYVNELEDGDSAADSYVVFGVDQVRVVDEIEA